MPKRGLAETLLPPLPTAGEDDDIVAHPVTLQQADQDGPGMSSWESHPVKRRLLGTGSSVRVLHVIGFREHRQNDYYPAGSSDHQDIEGDGMMRKSIRLTD